MSRNRLFWHLVRFHFQISPWFMFPLLLFVLLGTSLVFSSLGFVGKGISMGSYHNYDQILPYLYFFILASQLTWGMRWGRNACQNQQWGTGSYAFLFTRAIHRPTLYWAKLAVFVIVCLLTVLPGLIKTMIQPDIRIQLYQKPEEQKVKIEQYRSSYPELQVTVPEQNPKDQLVTLNGAGWDSLLLKFAQVMLLSMAILWLSALSWRWPKIWIAGLGLFIVGMFTPLLTILISKKSFLNSVLADDEQLLFWTHDHVTLIVAVLALLIALVTWDSHYRFLRITQLKNAIG